LLSSYRQGNADTSSVPFALLEETVMNQFDDRDNPDDSARPRHDEGIGEEVSATGQRAKGATKDVLGELTGDESLEEKGERENQAGRERQKKNDAI
jgi:uncharacterized protein YjbJ (UPF0337 family)